MGLIEYYLIFALATAIACWYEFFWPLLSEARKIGVDNEFTKYPVMSSLIYVIISTIIAPVLIVPFLSTEKSQRFKNGLKKSIFEQN